MASLQAVAFASVKSCVKYDHLQCYALATRHHSSTHGRNSLYPDRRHSQMGIIHQIHRLFDIHDDLIEQDS
jgi:hypothetical protein